MAGDASPVKKGGLRQMIDQKLARNLSKRGKRPSLGGGGLGDSSFISNISKKSGLSRGATVAIRRSRVMAPQRPNRLRESLARVEGLARGALADQRPSDLTERGGHSVMASWVLRGADLRSSNPFKIMEKDRETLLRASLAYSNFNVQEFNDIVKHPFDGTKAAGARPSALTEEPREPEYDPLRAQTSIFAVNSDVSFLYMIGRMCQDSGHNLKLGLQALNDYYLFMWHHSETITKIQNASKGSGSNQMKNPLSNSDDIFSHSNRTKECVKALLCIG